ncbi:alternative ribosome rescue aminoacyl-tRNA hydrolase ArfB [Namhaeicola litoreus]|uniref:Alternative ribosome rescue aminoacyl-tRNA hydrolase ArfB n=1 Tax=Namhaeicola litoreus TaxID=1052145 RepID=A0ABW3Y0C2_9FLAO
MDREIILKELNYSAVRSGGPGGQHVNKVSSKVVLNFDLMNSFGLSDDEKSVLQKNLKSKLSKEGLLILTSNDSRSQHKNKELVTVKLFKLLQKALLKPKSRRTTKRTKTSILKRLETKKKHAQIKNLRKKLD